MFDEPGNSDLTASVDFAYLREAMEPLVQTLGPISQGQFLQSMGLDVRVKKLVDHAADPARKNDITQAAERLIDPVGMGNQYKVMGIVPKSATEKEGIYPFIPLT